MEGVDLKKDLLFAVFLALTIHLCVAFARVPADLHPFHIKTHPKRSLAVSFVSTFSEIEKKTPLTPLTEEKRQVIVKQEKSVKKKAVHKENTTSPALETNTHKQREAQLINKTLSTQSTASPPGIVSIQEEAVFSPAIPRYLENSPPVYPSIARRRGYEGTVLLSANISADGTVANLRVRKSSGYSILDRTALKTVEKWKFESASRSGIPFTMWVDVPVRFVLE